MIKAVHHLLGVRLVRRSLIKIVDASAAAAALYIAVHLRMNDAVPEIMSNGLPRAMAVTFIVTAIVFQLSGLYRRAWRYVAVVDLVSVVTTATLSIAACTLCLKFVLAADWLPTSVPVIQWFVLLVAMSGARLFRRWLRDHPVTLGRQGEAAADPATAVQRVLLIGEVDRIETTLRAIETTQRGRYRPVGILEVGEWNRRLRLRGVRVLGSADSVEHVVKQLDIEGQRPHSLFIVDGPERLTGPAMVRLVNRAESLGVSVARIADTVGVAASGTGELDLRFIEMAELLSRPQAQRDSSIARAAIAGMRVLVTGAGGTIGSELVRQIAVLEPAEIVLLDHCEFSLYSIDMEMRENFPHLKCHPVLCSIRQRECLMHAFATHLPELVFHAAALKHVPLVEVNPCAGVLTNVLGTRNVADAVRRFGARAMVQVSTDKAVNPVGIMGATKRLGELYCQALDLAGDGRRDTPRFMTVRFGNVLGSSGSLIPLFQRQLSRRVPLTITHPEIKRFFMTVHEAVQLILQSTAQAVAENTRRGRIFVLDMGEPIKIIDIARRMIRLAGLEPDVDVKIDIVGLRPGEKLYEEMFDSRERRLESTLQGVFEAEPDPVALPVLDRLFDRLEKASLRDDEVLVRELVRAAIDGTPVEPEAAMPVFEPARVAHMPRRAPAVRPVAVSQS